MHAEPIEAYIVIRPVVVTHRNFPPFLAVLVHHLVPCFLLLLAFEDNPWRENSTIYANRFDQ